MISITHPSLSLFLCKGSSHVNFETIVLKYYIRCCLVKDISLFLYFFEFPAHVAQPLINSVLIVSSYLVKIMKWTFGFDLVVGGLINWLFKTVRVHDAAYCVHRGISISVMSFSLRSH
jgi:hypothetical protein